MRYILLFVFLFLEVVAISQTALEWIKNDIGYLASDSLKGRKTGTQEGYKTALWIAKQYEAIGLKPYDSSGSYLQEFDLIKPEIISQNLQANGKQFHQDDFFILTSASLISVNQINDTPLFTIGPSDDFMTTFSEISGLTSSYIVIIDPVHQSRFNRLKKYMTRQSYQLKKSDNHYSLWILSDDTALEDFSMTSEQNNQLISGYNVIGVLPGSVSDSRRWVIGAHYDHLGVLKTTTTDSIANGANDNASGVAAMLSLARLLKTGKPSEKSVWFIAFDAEEMGLFGSTYFTNHFDNGLFEAVINLEMLGRPNDDLGNNSAYVSGYKLSDWPQKLTANATQFDFDFYPDPYPQLQLFRRSDNFPFAQYAIPAHTLSSYMENDSLYHRVGDEISTLDYEFMQNVIDVIYAGILPFFNMNYDPGVIDYKSKPND